MANTNKPRPTDPQARQENNQLPENAVEDAKQAIVYGVGYKRPPEHTRFRKGRSGNPKGRPKGDDLSQGGKRSASSLVLKEAARPVTIREGEETKQIPLIEAVFRAQGVSAIKHNSAYAQKHIIERYDRSYREERMRIKAENEVWERYVDFCREEIAQAERNGSPPSLSLPHPDDVVIDPDAGVRFVGPVDEEGATRLTDTLRLRDVLLLQQALDERQAGDVDGDGRPGTALLFARLLNMGIPFRYRLSEIEINIRILRLLRMPRRELLKTLYRAWREIGVRPSRGWTCPPLRWGAEFASAALEVSWKIANKEETSACAERLRVLLSSRSHSRW